MPELDYALLAEYVRQDAGMIHIMGAGADTFHIPAAALPVTVPLGFAARVVFNASDDHPGDPHTLRLEFTSADGEQLLSATQQFRTPDHSPGIPSVWRPSLGIALRLALPIPRHGLYALQAEVDDDPRLIRRIDFRAVEPGS